MKPEKLQYALEMQRALGAEELLHAFIRSDNPAQAKADLCRFFKNQTKQRNVLTNPASGSYE